MSMNKIMPGYHDHGRSVRQQMLFKKYTVTWHSRSKTNRKSGIYSDHRCVANISRDCRLCRAVKDNRKIKIYNKYREKPERVFLFIV